MTLQQLKYVIAIADSGSVNAASKRLYVSQPSLSSAVKDLEEEVGFEVFRRSNRGVIITAQGEEFLNYARQVCAQFALLEERFVSGQSKKKFSVSAQHYNCPLLPRPAQAACNFPCMPLLFRYVNVKIYLSPLQFRLHPFPDFLSPA